MLEKVSNLNKERLSINKVVEASKIKRPAFRSKIGVMSTKAKSRSYIFFVLIAFFLL